MFFFLSPTFLSQNVTQFLGPLKILWRISNRLHISEISPRFGFRGVIFLIAYAFP